MPVYHHQPVGGSRRRGRAAQIPRHGRADSRHRAAYARPRRNGAEPREAIQWWSAEVQAEPDAGSRIQRAARQAADQRSQPEIAGRATGVYELKRSGVSSGQVANAKSNRRSFDFLALRAQSLKMTKAGSGLWSPMSQKRDMGHPFLCLV